MTDNYNQTALTIFSQKEQTLLLCHLWLFQDLDLQQRHGSDLKKQQVKKILINYYYCHDYDSALRCCKFS